MADTGKIYSVLITVSVLLILASGLKLILSHAGNGTETAADPTALTSVRLIGDRQDIGTVNSDMIISRDVIIINEGPEMLKVEFVDPDCNCTGYTLTPANEAAIGDSLKLTLTIDMEHKKVGKFMLNTVVGMNTADRLHRIAIEGEIIK